MLAALEVTESREERMVGLLNRDGIDGAILIRPARSVHSVGMRFPLDVAFCDGDLVVVDIVRMGRGRVGRPRRKPRVVVADRSYDFDKY